MKRSFLSLSAVLLSSVALADAPQQEECRSTARPYRATFRHIEANGIGYNQGYSTVELFTSSCRSVPSHFLPFLDLRFHVFNDGKPAANAGFGLRYIASSWVFGINSYYDYRKTHWQHYKQASLGLEALGKIWDFRVNGYLPVGWKSSSFHETKFSHFSGNQMILSRKKEFALKGINGEIGMHIRERKQSQFYAALGPYYFEGKGKNAIGGEARFNGLFFQHLKAEVSGSYDSLYRWICQGQVSLVFPMGPRKHLSTEDQECNHEVRLRERALQPIDRTEIIPVKKKRSSTVAIDPRTNAPYTFWFVDNTSHSAGTFESPFSTLAAAEKTSSPYDAVYVFTGDGSTVGLDTGFSMQDYQKLLGSAVSHPIQTQQGTVVIPQMTNAFPSLTLATDPSSARGIVNMANDCEVAGLLITSSISTSRQAGVYANASTSPFVRDMVVSGAYLDSGIYLKNCVGDCVVQDNTLSSITASSGASLHITDTAGSNAKNLGIIGNQITVNQSGETSGILINTQGSLCANITNNTVQSSIASSVGIQWQNTGPAAQSAVFLQNTLSVPTTGTSIALSTSGTSTCAVITRNSLSSGISSNSNAMQIDAFNNLGNNTTITGSYTPIEASDCICQYFESGPSLPNLSEEEPTIVETPAIAETPTIVNPEPAKPFSFLGWLFS